MRKRLITPSPAIVPAPDDDCLYLDRVASVDVTSEEKDYGLRVRWYVRKSAAGVPPILELKQSGYSSMSRKDLDASRYFSRKTN